MQEKVSGVKEMLHVTDKHIRILSIIAREKHVLLFDLEVQELTLLGLVEDADGALLLTDRGRTVLAAATGSGAEVRATVGQATAAAEPGFLR